MKSFRLLSAVDQLAMHLRQEILRGSLQGTMPGVLQLAETLGTSPKTVVEAVKLLEHQGLLVGQGRGCRSRIVIPKGLRPPELRIAIFLYEPGDLATGYIIELKHQLQEAGHVVTYSTKYLMHLEKDLEKVVRYVRKTPADAWVVICGSLAVLEWFAAQPVPALAMCGRMREVSMPGVMPHKLPALEAAVRRLVALGHRRIVIPVREHKLMPQPGLSERRFLEVLEAEGIPTGPYNLPDWQGSPEGLCRCLDSLFGPTPPTAIIIDEAPVFTAARLHLAHRGITSPQDVSVICLDPDPLHALCRPQVSHLYWDTDAMVRRIVQWANKVASGKKDRRKTFLKTEFIEGGTIGPVKDRG